MSTKQKVIECIAALFILLFLYTSISKFLDFRHFFAQMNNQPFPKSWTPFLVWGIPCLEITISVALFFERTRLAGLCTALVLMGLFTFYTAAILLHFFPYIPCSCGGVIQQLTWRQHLVFNLFFVALAVWGILLQRKHSFTFISITNKNSFK